MPEYTLTIHRGKWSLTFRDGDDRRRISSGTADRGRAEAFAREWWDRHTAAPSDRVADLWPRYVKDRIAVGARPDRFKAHWTALEPHFGYRLGTSNQPRGLPRLSCGQAGAGLFGQHYPHRLGTAARLSALAVWGCRAQAMGSASIEAARPLANQTTGPEAGGRGEKPAHQAIRDFRAIYRGAGRGHTGPNVGSDRLRPRDNRLSPIWPTPDEQAAHRGSHEPDGPRGAGGSLSGAAIALRGGVRRQTGGIGQEGAGTAFSGHWYQIFAARSAAHLCGVAGASGRTDAEDRAVSRTHFNAGDRAGLCPLFAHVHAGRICGGDVLIFCQGVYIGTQGNLRRGR